MKHTVTLEQIFANGGSRISTTMAGSHGKGENKSLNAVWDIETDKRWIEVRSGGVIAGVFDTWQEAIDCYNEQ